MVVEEPFGHPGLVGDGAAGEPVGAVTMKDSLCGLEQLLPDLRDGYASG